MEQENTKKQGNGVAPPPKGLTSLRSVVPRFSPRISRWKEPGTPHQLQLRCLTSTTRMSDRCESASWAHSMRLRSACRLSTKGPAHLGTACAPAISPTSFEHRLLRRGMTSIVIQSLSPSCIRFKNFCDGSSGSTRPFVMSGTTCFSSRRVCTLSTSCSDKRPPSAIRSKMSTRSGLPEPGRSRSNLSCLVILLPFRFVPSFRITRQKRGRVCTPAESPCRWRPGGATHVFFRIP